MTHKIKFKPQEIYIHDFEKIDFYQIIEMISHELLHS